ncbi:MAG: hypothetical protein ABF868_12150 [Sporolactobacillus sp.]
MIESAGEKLLVSGDLSFKAGRTIPGACVSARARPDALVLESACGNRDHSDRNTFNFPAVVTVAERTAVCEQIRSATGWTAVFSPSVRVCLLSDGAPGAATSGADRASDRLPSDCCN